MGTFIHKSLVIPAIFSSYETKCSDIFKENKGETPVVRNFRSAALDSV
jgi:hypothetical protein